MSNTTTGTIECPQCQTSQVVEVYSSINVQVHPELRDKFFAQDINVFTCENCGLEEPIPTDLMYHDMDKQFVVYLVPDGNFASKKAELDRVPDFGEISDYLRNPLFVKDYKEALFMVHICEKNGAPKTDEDKQKYHQAYNDISDMYNTPMQDEHELPHGPFDLLDVYQNEGYEWACGVLLLCGPLTGIRSDLIPYALAMIFDDFIYTVLDYPKVEWEYVLDEAFGDHEEVWKQVYAVRREIFAKLEAKIGTEAIYISLEEITETVDSDEPDVTIASMSDSQRLELRQFVTNGLGY